MENTSNNWDKMPREMYYYRQRFKNAVFSRLQKFFVDEAERTGITKKDIATRLRRDPAQITRWLSNPSNLTIETLSDLLFAMEAEPAPPVFIKLAEQRPSNYMNPLIAKIMGGNMPPPPPSAVTVITRSSGTVINRSSGNTVSVPVVPRSSHFAKYEAMT